MFQTFKNRLELQGTLKTITALRISQGRSTEPIGSDLPVVKDALGKPFIPGASFKGALRSRLESFLRGVDSTLADDPNQLVSSDRMASIRDLKEQWNGNDEALTAALWAQTDLASRLFGSPWIASKFQVRDLTVNPETWFGQYQERDGVSIDRDTETAADGRLYDFQVVPAGTEFAFRAVVENAEEIELGLLMIGLHQFETEQIPLGGGRSRGLGVVKLLIDQAWWIDPDGQPDQLITYLERLVSRNLDQYKMSSETLESYAQDWTEDLITHLRSHIPAPASR
ncbi:MAG: CRISPR-associated RAMP protein Csx7 [Leptolyngbya sp. Prado105]|jgi:CRISPR-associated RAMP protein (TIGR02581 family)|nr:CRISPR-associated RAMP protein Csx7 [Leptolyngbya sp. Prado105]